MRVRSVSLSVFVVVSALSLPNPAVWGAGVGPNAPCLRQPHDSWPGIVIRGTAAAIMRPGVTADHFDIDLTLRLRRNGEEETFRVRLVDVLRESPEHVACLALDAQPIDIRGNTIDEFFNVPLSYIRRLNTLSIKRYTGVAPIPRTGDTESAMADIIIHYVDPEGGN